jgi:hypothetical protein
MGTYNHFSESPRYNPRVEVDTTWAAGTIVGVQWVLWHIGSGDNSLCEMRDGFNCEQQRRLIGKR